MPLAPAVEDLLEELLKLYRGAQESLIDELVRAASDTTASSAAYRSRLAGLARAVTAEMADLDRAARAFSRDEIPTVYQLGAQTGADDIGTQFRWNQIHREAVRELAADTYADLLAATRYVRRDVKAFIRFATRERVRGVLLEGDTATRAGRRLAARLQDRGIAAVTYRNGARHSLRDYSDTVVRSQAAKAQNAGTLNMGRQFGVQWVQVQDGTGCGWTSHDSGDTANGSVRTLQEAEAQPTSHPRCARSFSLLPVATRPEAERLAAGDLSDVRLVEAPKPTPPSHQRRIDQRQARLEARAAKVRS